jgi:type I restriction enzyme M protein
MDQAVWAALEVLRDRLDAAGVRDWVLTLVALRHLSARPDAPQAARWSRIAAGEILEAIAALEEHDPALRGAFPQLPALEGSRRDDLVAAVGALSPDGDGDVLGRAYMSLVAMLARAEGRRGGQYYTPTSVADLLVALAAPVEGALVYDPCCGTGGLLVAAARAGAEALVGQELNPATRRLARLALAVHDRTLDLGERAADTLRDDQHPDLQADVVLANPPFNLARWGAEDLAHDPRFALGTAPDGNANLAWIQHVLARLRPGGRAAVVLSNGSLTVRAEADLRAALVGTGRLEAVVALPDRLFRTTAIPACVWVLGPVKDTILFVDARHRGRRVDRSTRVLDPDDRGWIAGRVRAHRDEERVALPGQAMAVPRERVGAELAPGRWVGARPATEEGAVTLEAALVEVRRLSRASRELEEALLAGLRTLEDG